MDELCLKIDGILNACSRILNMFERENDNYMVTFKNFSNGQLLQFVKSVQIFFKIFNVQNCYTLFVCISQIKKCLCLYEKIISKDETWPGYEKVVCIYLINRIQKCFYKLRDVLPTLEKTDVDEKPGIFIDQMNSVLSDLSKRVELKLIKPKIDQIIFQAITIAKISDDTNNLELTSSSKYVLKAIKNFEKIDIMEKRDFFHFDYLSSSLSILERRINTAVLHQIYEVFNDPFCTIKALLKLWANSVQEEDLSSDLPEKVSYYVTDLDKTTDAIIQIGLFAVACCKNTDYVIRLKSSIASLELLDCDIIPAFFDFNSPSETKKQFLKLLINHWIDEISEIQNLLEKIIDPFAFAQITIETSTNTIISMNKSDSGSNNELCNKLLNGFLNFEKYVKNIFASEIYKENELSYTYRKFKNALNEYKACLTHFQERNDNNDIIKDKLLKRSNLVLKNLQNMQLSIFNVMKDKSLPEFENTTYILSKTKKLSDHYIPFENIDDNNLNLLFSSIQTQKSFYNSVKKISQTIQFNDQDIFSDTCNEHTNGKTVIMELTNILDNFIDTCNKNNDQMASDT